MTVAGYASQMSESDSIFDLRDDSASRTDREVSGSALETVGDARLVTHRDADAVFVEQYRRLAATLHQAQLLEGIRSLVVTSAVGGEGKTLSATNLALTLSRSFGRRVLLVDADLRKPAVHGLLELQNRIGLTDILKGPGGVVPAQPLSPTFSVLTSGQAEPEPVPLLVSEAARQFLAEARDHFDWVVVDTPPVVLFPDAGLIAGKVDACVMVVRAAATSSPLAAKAVAALGSSRIHGVVLNRAEPAHIAAAYGYEAYGYAARTLRRRRGWWRGRGA